MPALPAHRVLQSSIPHGSRGVVPSAYHHGYPYSHTLHSSGSRGSLSSQPQSKRRTASLKDHHQPPSNNKKTPLVVDRKQAVYNINQSIPPGLQISPHRPISKGVAQSDKRHSLTENGDRVVHRSDHRSSKNAYDSSKRKGVYEPVIVRGEIKGNIGEPKRLERDPDGRLYEVVQTRLVESKVSHHNYPNFVRDRLSLPTVALVNNDKKWDKCDDYSQMGTLTSASGKLDNSSDVRNSDFVSVSCPSVKDNAQKMSLSSSKIERSTREAIERIRKNVEKKQEYLMRPNEPLWLPDRKNRNVHRDYHVNPQKMPPPIWPPHSNVVVYTTTSNGGTSRTSSFVVGPKGRDHILRRTKSEYDSSTIFTLADSAHVQTTDSVVDPPRTNSLPSSPTANDNGTPAFPEFSTYTQTSKSGSINPLTGNIVAKPYGSHLYDDSGQMNKYSKTFVSTLSRIQENIPTSNQDCKESSKISSSPTATTTPSANSVRALPIPPGSHNINYSTIRTVPLAWVGDNERIKQLHIVSTRAKKFEKAYNEKDSHKSSALHRFELSRLSQRTKAVNVSQRKEEIEKRDGNSHLSFDPGNELGRSFNWIPKHSKLEGGSYQPPGRVHPLQGNVMRSYSEGGNMFPVSKEFLSLPEEPYIPVVYEEGAYKGNRTTPVGGSKIHCDPPLHEGAIQSSDTLERDRSHSTCSYTPLWSDYGDETETIRNRKSSSPLVRQHSFHSTIRSHFAKAVGSLQRSGGGGFEASSAVDGTKAILSDSRGGYGYAPSTNRALSRRKFLAEETSDRLVRRVSYLKATSGDRIHSDSEIESEDERLAAGRPGVVKRALIGHLGSDLPSPASLLSSVTTQGSLHVKLDRHLGKRAADRSWKSVYATIKGRALLIYKDKHHEAQSPLSPEDQLSLKGADVGVATNYTKRRNVLRLSTAVGSQLLLQTESDSAMTAWLTSLASASSQDADSVEKSVSLPAGPESNIVAVDGTPAGSMPASSPTNPSLLSYGNEGQESVVVTPTGDASSKNSKKLVSPTRSRAPVTTPTAPKPRKSAGENTFSPKSKTWKERIGKHLPKKPSGPGPFPLTSPSTPLPEGASIGVNLKDCPPAPENEFVPLVVSLCVKVVEMKGLHCQGIYRIPGNIASVSHLTETVNRGPDAIDLTDTRWSDLNVISSLLKQFFQKLPDSLVTSELYPRFIESSRMEDQQQRLVMLKNLVQDLPIHNYETLHYLMQHLNNIVLNCDQNKMSVANLATVFGPTLIRAADDNVTKMVTDMSHQCRIVMTLITHFNWIFNEDSLDVPIVDRAVNATEMETSSYEHLLSSVKKIEGSHKEKNKLLASIFDAADRLQRSRHKKIEEEPSTIDTSPATNNADDYRANELPDPIPMSQRRVSSMSLSSIAAPRLDKLPGSIRDGRLFQSDADCLLPFDGLSSLSSLNTISAPHSVSASSTKICTTVNSAAVAVTSASHSTDHHNHNSSKLSKSEPSGIGGDDRAIRSYTDLTAATQERIRRFEQETTAMLQRDFTRHQRETKKWEFDKKKLEDDWHRAKQDLETEDLLDQLADNPSQIVPKMGSYPWSPSSQSSNKEAVSLSSLRSTKSSEADLKHPGLSFANTSLQPVSTNASTKNERFLSQDSGEDPRVPRNEGSDLLSAITATFEEKMKDLQESSISCQEATPEESTSSFSSGSNSVCISGRSTPMEPWSLAPPVAVARSKFSGNCRLYRDPSLHRRKNSPTSTAAMTMSSLAAVPCSDSAISRDFGIALQSTSLKRSDSLSKSEKTENNLKEKTEKRSRELKRTDIQESLREKRPKELKRSSTQDCIILRSRDGDSHRHSAELKSRRHNVQELKEKFEQSSQLYSSNGAVSTPPISTSTTVLAQAEKVSRNAAKQARKSRIKRRHTVGGMKDVARVAWLKVIEAAYYNELQKSQTPSQLPSWEQLQLFIEALSEGKKVTVESQQQQQQQQQQLFIAKEQLGATSSPDLENLLSLVLPTHKKEALKRRLSVREANKKPLHPLLESNV